MADLGSPAVSASQCCDRTYQPDRRILLNSRVVVAPDRADSAHSRIFVEVGRMALLPLVLLGAPAIAVMHIVCKYIDARWLICLNSLGFAWAFYWLGRRRIRNHVPRYCAVS
ncbi:MAG: hypothetical protein H0V35_12855 [Nitrospira sp.]|nr:hypothetical protein [Nitrospira sp.]